MFKRLSAENHQTAAMALSLYKSTTKRDPVLNLQSEIVAKCRDCVHIQRQETCKCHVIPVNMWRAGNCPDFKLGAPRPFAREGGRRTK